MIKAAEKASKSIIRDFGEIEKLQVSKKGPKDFVTKTDKHVEKIIIEELSKIKKNYSFLSEEVGKINNKDKEMYFSEKNKGAFLNNQRLRVSKKSSLDECLFSSNHEGVKFSDLNMRYTGSAALDLAYVASGRLDGYFHNKINLWDVAAGALMVEEAGGIVNDLNKFNTKNIDIRASSSVINDKMLKKLENF